MKKKSVLPNAPGCDYPIPKAGSKNWTALAEMFRGLARRANSRANELTREESLRALAAGTRDAYAFSALMIDTQRDKNCPLVNIWGERFR